MEMEMEKVAKLRQYVTDCNKNVMLQSHGANTIDASFIFDTV